MLPPANTVRFGLQSLSFVGSLVWDRLSKDVKSSTTFNTLRGKLKMVLNYFCTCPYVNYGRYFTIFYKSLILLVTV